VTAKRPTLAVVSNRIPITCHCENGQVQIQPSSGGLVSALEPLLENNGGVWVGSPGGCDSPDARRLLAAAARRLTYQYAPVFLSAEEHKNFYQGFSNEVLWPLFHDLQSRCNFDPKYWRCYQEVNHKFARAAERASGPRTLIWIHDYHLMQAGRTLRARHPEARLAFFLHIPFPPPDIFEKLPWRREILEGLLEHDLIGLQTRRDERNFVACLRSFVPSIKIAGWDEGHAVISERRRTHIRFFPISIDYRKFAAAAASAPVRERAGEVKRRLGNLQIALGVDRLDYTKGIPERLKAYRSFLRNYPKFHRQVELIQIVVPSRESIPRYQDLKNEVERLIGEINGEFGEPGWIPINYIHRSMPREELIAIYGAADVALITPLKDGMNLVAKEYCAARAEADGVLVLSEFAGAAPELRNGALLVNPYDEDGMAAAIKQALQMPTEERHRRMLRMRNQIRDADVLKWRDRFFAAVERTPAAR
jgi:trehalose 6-phosphate synthase/phosphatase